MQIEDCQKELANLGQPHAKTPSSERSLRTSFSSASVKAKQQMRPHSGRKEEKYRVIEWIKECEKGEIFDLIDDEPRKKIQGVVTSHGCGLQEEISPTSSTPDNLIQLDDEFPPLAAECLQMLHPPSRTSSIGMQPVDFVSYTRNRWVRPITGHA